MAVIRAFIAIDLSPEIQQRLRQVTEQLKQRLQDVPVRWVAAGNIHLTLKFLGDVSPANLELLEKILQTEVEHFTPFEVSVGDLGAFPSERRPRVIWVGVKAPPELGLLQRAIDTETARLGYNVEDRSFSPHLTLGRVARNATPREVARIGEVLSSYRAGFLGATRVAAVHLFRSDLQPGGAVYSRLFTAALSPG